MKEKMSADNSRHHRYIVIGPVIGAVFMNLSTIIVAINVQLLRKRIGNKLILKLQKERFVEMNNCENESLANGTTAKR